jgi:Family of unknown function (DUF6151)
VPVRPRARRASDVSPSSGWRFVYYCKNCQAFARFLERPDVLDPAGGTDIFQIPPGRVKLTVDKDAVRCLRLSEKGVLRWYTDCCRTRIGNTAVSPRFPVMAVVHSSMVHGADGRSRDEMLGPPLCRIYDRSALGPLPPNVPAPSLRVLARRVSKNSAGGCSGSAGGRRSRRPPGRPARRAARAHAEGACSPLNSACRQPAESDLGPCSPENASGVSGTVAPLGGTGRLGRVPPAESVERLSEVHAGGDAGRQPGSRSLDLAPRPMRVEQHQ